MREAIVEWTGFSGAPGFNVFYFAGNAVDIPAALNAFYTGCASAIPNDVTINIPSSGKEIDPLTGDLTGAWAEAPVAAVAGSAAGSYAAPSGAIVRWNTSGVVNNRIVRGRTFLVPLASLAYDTDGSLGTTQLGNLRSAATALADHATAILDVWSRPLEDAAGGVIRQGSAHLVESATVPDFVSVLRSRRD